MITDSKFRAHLAECMREYFGTANKPMTLMRAETDLLVRVLTNQYAMLAGQMARAEEAENKKPDPHFMAGITQAGTDLALIASICGKLRDSEKETRG